MQSLPALSYPDGYHYKESRKYFVLYRTYQQANDLRFTGYVSASLFQNRFFQKKLHDPCQLSLTFSKETGACMAVDITFSTTSFSEKLTPEHLSFVYWQLQKEQGDASGYTYYVDPDELMHCLVHLPIEDDIHGAKREETHVTMTTVLKQAVEELYDESTSITFCLYQKRDRQYAVLLHNHTFYYLMFEFGQPVKQTSFPSFEAAYEALKEELKGR